MSILQDEKPINKSPDGRFLKFDEELGRGTFKVVYRGLDIETGIGVAWCEIEKDKFTKQELQKFKEEASILKKLEHSSIVKFYDFWECLDIGRSGHIVFITELMTSGTLKLYIERFKTLNIEVVKHWSRQILCGLNFLHTRNPPFIHRNLKCDNIFIVGATGNVKIGGLGFSAFKNKAHAKSAIDIPEFLAPEMYDENYDEAVDVYAFGMCLLEMITGEYPYAECNFPVQVYKKVTAGLRPDCFYKISDEYGELKDIIDRCIRVNINERITIRQLMGHSFFAVDEQHGIKISINTTEENRLKSSMSTQIELNGASTRKQAENKLDESEELKFFSEYVGDRVENSIPQSTGQYHVSESDTKVLNENEDDKIVDISSDFQSERTSLSYCVESTNNSNLLIQNSINTLTMDSYCKMKCDNSNNQSQTIKKGRFDVKTVNIAPSTIDQSSKVTESSHGIVKNDEMENDVFLNHESVDVSLFQSMDNNNVIGNNIGISKTDLGHYIHAETVGHQNFYEPELGTTRYAHTLSEEQMNMLSKQVENDILTAMLLQHAINKNVTDFSSQQYDESVKTTKAIADDLDIPVYSATNNLLLNTDNIIASNYNDKNIISSNDPPIDRDRNFVKNLNSYIHNLELGLRKLSNVCGVKLNFESDINQTNTGSENVFNCQKVLKSNYNDARQKISKSLVHPQTNQTESQSGVNVNELKHLLEMTQKQITLQQQMLLTVIENKSSKLVEQSGLFKDSNIGNNCDSNQVSSMSIQQRCSTSIEEYLSQPQIRKHGLQINGPSDYLQPPSDNKKLLPSTFSDKSTSANNGQSYQQSDVLPPPQVPSHNIGTRKGIDEIDKKLDSTHQGQKVCNDTIVTTLNNVRKNSVTHMYEDKRKESIIPTSSLHFNSNNLDNINSISNVQMPEKVGNLPKDYLCQNSVESFNEEISKKLSLHNCNLVNLLSQEVEDMLNYQKSSNTAKNISLCVCRNSTYSCHSPEYHSIIEADLDVIEKESELYKIDKLVFRTLERHKRELLELRNRQCTELREIKHLTSLMALKTQELIKAIKSRK